MIKKRNDTNPEYGINKYGNVEFADDVNKKYPIDTPQHIRAAWRYIHLNRDKTKYNNKDLKIIEQNIINAWKNKINKNGPPEDIDSQ